MLSLRKYSVLAVAVSCAYFSTGEARAQDVEKEVVSADDEDTGQNTENAPKGRSDENAVEAAEDAFGNTVGREGIGLYNSGSVRGFSPTVAGNLRVEGLFFDQQAGLTGRIQSGSTIKVGIAAQSDPFPAPTGIVDISLRNSGKQNVLSALASYGPFGSVALELDGQLSIKGEELSVAGGAAIFADQFSNGGSGTFTSFGFVPRWRPAAELEFAAFWGRTDTFDETAPPIYIPRDAALPPRIERGSYDGPAWALRNGLSDNIGLTGQAALGDWTVNLGVFRSLSRSDSSFGNIVEDIAQDGDSQRSIFANPPSRFRSYSGELRISRGFKEGPRQHLLLVSVRGRDVKSRFGGSDFIDLGRATIGENVSPPRPDFTFSTQTINTVNQITGGLSYGLKWEDFFELRAGLQRTDYEQNVASPGAETNNLNTKKWLPNFTASIQIRSNLFVYGSYTKGLEENGQAPDFATNRLDILPALETRQFDVGLRWKPLDDVDIVVGYFDVTKPYFNLDINNFFGELGEETHTGLELSLSATPITGLKIVGGAVLQDPRVTSNESAAQEIGIRPVGQPRTFIQLNADYQLPFFDGASLDLSVSHNSKQAADVRNDVFVPAFTTFNVGARYAFKIGESPATLRLTVNNITNKFVYLPIGSGVFEPLNQRSYSAYMAVDF